MTIKKEEVVSLGIVLKTHPYKESDSLVTVYFKDYGKMTLIARGVKKLKSKNASACQSLTLSEFTFIPRNGLSTMIKASSVDFYRYIKENLELEAYASYFMEFVLKNEEDNQPDLEIFDTLKKSLDALNHGYPYPLVYLLYNAFILKRCGMALQVDGCVRCLRQDHIAGISLEDGGFVCHDCLSLHDKQLDKVTLKAFRHINKLTIDSIDQLKVPDESIDLLLEIMDYYVDEMTGILFKTKKMIQSLSKI